MRPSQAFHAVETLRESLSVPLCRKGVVLSDNDNLTVLDVYQQWILLMIDLDYLHPESLSRDVRRLWTDIVQVDVYDLNSAFAECLHLVRLQTNKGFKALCKTISSHLYNIIKDDIESMVRGDVYAAKRLIQLFSYTGRLTLHDIDLTQQCLDDYMATEERLESHLFRPEIAKWLNKIVKSWFGPFVPGELIPAHGPGGVAGLGRCSLETKYRNLAQDQRLLYSCSDALWPMVERFPSTLERISQTIFVPKSFKTFRTISMEPATLMFYQQGVLALIDQQVQDSPYLKAHIDTHDQERNQKLAQEGSSNRSLATIDLSAASDSVSYQLVKEVFKGTWMLRYLVTLRSPKTLLPDGRLVELLKFAPMGSALCFPIETIIFAALCEHVTRVYGVAGQYSVYGDDIIVPTQCVETLVRFLGHLGFLVNHDKSFYDSTCWFRESCGGEYCNGFDVTPIRVSRSYASTNEDECLTALIDSANEAYTYGYRNIRYFFISKLRAKGYTPFFAPTSLLSDNYTNYHTKHRWNTDLQCIQVKASALVERANKKDIQKQDESIRYQHWLVTTYSRQRLEEAFESVVCRTSVKLRNAWWSKPYEISDQDRIDKELGRG